MKPPEVKPETKEHNGKKGIPFSILFCSKHSYLHHYNTGIYGGEKSVERFWCSGNHKKKIKKEDFFWGKSVFRIVYGDNGVFTTSV